MSFEKVFVTVGTTKFDKLIETLMQKDTIKVLKQRRCRYIQMQIGAAEFEPNLKDDQILLAHYRFKNSILDDIKTADLVISHAGAGTCLDVLGNGKPLITVINDGLMHNHQTELAEKLQKDGYCRSCTCETLPSLLQSMDPSTFSPFINDNDLKCATIIENFLFEKLP